MQVCSVLHVAHVGVRRVTVVIVHIGHEDVVVVVYFCVAIFVRDFLYQEMYSLHTLAEHRIRKREQFEMAKIWKHRMEKEDKITTNKYETSHSQVARLSEEIVGMKSRQWKRCKHRGSGSVERRITMDEAKAWSVILRP